MLHHKIIFLLHCSKCCRFILLHNFHKPQDTTTTTYERRNVHTGMQATLQTTMLTFLRPWSRSNRNRSVSSVVLPDTPLVVACLSSVMEVFTEASATWLVGALTRAYVRDSGSWPSRSKSAISVPISVWPQHTSVSRRFTTHTNEYNHYDGLSPSVPLFSED